MELLVFIILILKFLKAPIIKTQLCCGVILSLAKLELYSLSLLSLNNLFWILIKEEDLKSARVLFFSLLLLKVIQKNSKVAKGYFKIFLNNF